MHLRQMTSSYERTMLPVPRSSPKRFVLVRWLGIAFAVVAATCGTENDGGACLGPPPAEGSEGEDPACVAEPAGQICDQGSQLCQSVCDPSEYLFVCRARAGISYATLPVPSEALHCGPLRAPVPAVKNQAMYCCPCAPE
jgi:hypothetical protein